MDVWFDSGSSFNAVMVNGHHPYPVDLYLEGADQFRGWFNSSLTISVACYDKAPYKNVVTHGWVLDEHGEQMHKSKGNGVDPSKMANVFGADILRLWVGTVNYQQDVRIGENLLKQVAEQYRKIRNTFKFLLGNLSNGEISKFNPKKDAVDKYEVVDEFILAKLEEVKNSVIASFDGFDFASGVSKIMTFMSADLSSFYLDIGKDILYCDGKNSLRRKQMQNVIYKLCSELSRMLAPILPFTMEEVDTFMPDYDGKSIALKDFPKTSHNYAESVLANYAKFLTYRDEVNKAIEDIRSKNIVGSSQEALIVSPDADILKATGLDKNLGELAKLLIVSKVEINSSLKAVEAHHIDAVKCPRCWNYVDKLVKVDEETEVCARCAEVLKHE